ncbi:MAG: pitrilysin family protein [Alphaproteobacteria bacterium]|nr:pitrilysin family protein [Alphaproteobacteria bacterium]
MGNPDTKLQTLSNGVRCVSTYVPNSSLIKIQVGVCIGSNHEENGEEGLAHFFEHMCFKGTEMFKTPQALISHMENNGIIANAYTSLEATTYYLEGLVEKKEIIFSTSADILLNSTFPEEEVKKEAQVVIQELKMYEDEPSSYIGQKVLEEIFADTPLRHPIGKKEVIETMTREKFLNFYKKHYHAGNIICSVSGGLSHDESFALCEKHFSILSKTLTTPLPTIFPMVPKKKFVTKQRTDIQQDVIDISMRAYGDADDRRYALTVATHILGGGMSARLFSEIRENLAACYSIKSDFDPFSHFGIFGITTQIDPSKRHLVLNTIALIISELKKNGPTQEELDRVTTQLVSRFIRRSELSTVYANSNFISLVKNIPIISPEEYITHISKVTAIQVQEVLHDVVKGEYIVLGICSPDIVTEEVGNALYTL